MKQMFLEIENLGLTKSEESSVAQEVGGLRARPLP